MSRWKYAALMSDEPGTVLPAAHSSRPFDLNRLGSRKWTALVTGSLYRALLAPILRILQIAAPVARLVG